MNEESKCAKIVHLLITFISPCGMWILRFMSLKLLFGNFCSALYPKYREKDAYDYTANSCSISHLLGTRGRFRGAPLLFLQKQGTWLCVGTRAPPIFFLNSVGAPSIENSWICPSHNNYKMTGQWQCSYCWRLLVAQWSHRSLTVWLLVLHAVAITTQSLCSHCSRWLMK